MKQDIKEHNDGMCAALDRRLAKELRRHRTTQLVGNLQLFQLMKGEDTMAMKGKATKGEGGNFEIPDADTYQACLVGVIDLGWHPYNWAGVDKGLRRKLCLVWEILASVGEPTIRMVKKEDGKPFVMAREYLFSLEEKAGLRKDLEKYRRKPFGPDEEIDLSRAAGTVWALDVVHKPSATDPQKIYANIGSVGPLAKGTKTGKPVYTPFIYDTEEDEAFVDREWLPRLYGQVIADLVALGRSNGATVREGGGDEVPAGVADSSDVQTPF